MNTIWIIPAVLSFFIGQAYLFGQLGRLDRFPEHWDEDRCRYPEEDVVE